MLEIISAREAKAAHWRELIAAQAKSGQSIRVFCAERQINSSTFYYWREKFSHAEQGMVGKKRLGRFIALSHSDFKRVSPRIILPNGVAIDLGDGLDASSVVQFLFNFCGVGSTRGHYPSKDGHSAKS